MISSKPEEDLIEFIESKFPELFILTQYRPKFLDGKEIDIFLPSINVGIEYNGSMFHATKNKTFKSKPKNYHISKYMKCVKNNVHLISIFDIFYIKYKTETLDKLEFAIKNHHIIQDKNVYDLNYDYYPYVNMENYAFCFYNVDKNLNTVSESCADSIKVYTCGLFKK